MFRTGNLTLSGWLTPCSWEMSFGLLARGQRLGPPPLGGPSSIPVSRRYVSWLRLGAIQSEPGSPRPGIPNPNRASPIRAGKPATRNPQSQPRPHRPASPPNSTASRSIQSRIGAVSVDRYRSSTFETWVVDIASLSPTKRWVSRVQRSNARIANRRAGLARGPLSTRRKSASVLPAIRQTNSRTVSASYRQGGFPSGPPGRDSDGAALLYPEPSRLEVHLRGPLAAPSLSLHHMLMDRQPPPEQPFHERATQPPWPFGHPDVCLVTGPTLLLWFRHEVRPHRVQVKVREEMLQVVLVLHELALVSAAEQRAVPGVDAIETAGVVPIDVLHGPGDIPGHGAQEQVIVTRHQRVGVDLDAAPKHGLSDDIEEEVAVKVFVEDGSAPRPPLPDVMPSSRIVDSWWSSHSTKVNQMPGYVKWGCQTPCPAPRVLP